MEEKLIKIQALEEKDSKPEIHLPIITTKIKVLKVAQNQTN
jgi:hypothetical protein